MSEPSSGEGGTPPGLSRLPPGRHGLSREFVVRNQRDRIAAGVIAAVADHGYHETTISQIAAGAGVSRRTFYTYFESKEQCFHETYDMVAEYLLEAAREAADAAGEEWPARVRARVVTILEAFATNPDLVRFLLIAPSRAGEEVALRQRDAMDRAMSDLIAEFPPPPATREVSGPARVALIGGAAALLVEWVEEGRGERLTELAPELTELLLTPFFGREEAGRAIQAP